MKKHLYLKYVWFKGIKKPIIWRDEIPFECWSSYYTVLLQSQLATYDLTWYKLIKALLKSYITSPLKGKWYKFKHNTLGIPIIWYTMSKKGLFMNTGKPTIIKKGEVWTKYTFKKGKTKHEQYTNHKNW